MSTDVHVQTDFTGHMFIVLDVNTHEPQNFNRMV